MGQVNDVSNCVTMDLKQAGSLIYIVGQTHREFGGSHFGLVMGRAGGQVPTVDADHARDLFVRLHRAIEAGCVTACHDLSEGGLSVGLAEMAFAGGLGAEIDLQNVPLSETASLDATDSDALVIRLFSESNSRFIVEVPVESATVLSRISTVNQSLVLDTFMIMIDSSFRIPLRIEPRWMFPLTDSNLHG